MATRSKSATYLSARNFFPEKNNTNNPGKRRREDAEPPEITLLPPSDRTDSERTITETFLQQNNQDFDEREAVKIDRLVDKKDRYESHIQFLTKCLTEKVVPLGLAVQVEPTIGNHDEEFLNKWYEKLNGFSFELMKDIIEFCKSTSTDVSGKIKELDASIKSQVQPSKYKQITKALQENQDIRRRNLQQRKSKKFNRLKYKPNHQTAPPRVGHQTEIFEQSNDFKSRTNDRRHLRTRNAIPSYASVLKNKSNTDQRQNNNFKPSQGINPNRDEQIKKLEEQVRELRNQRNNPPPPKNWGGAPRVGASTTKKTTEMSTKDIMTLIQNTMQTLNAFATQLDNQNSLQIRQEM